MSAEIELAKLAAQDKLEKKDKPFATSLLQHAGEWTESQRSAAMYLLRRYGVTVTADAAPAAIDDNTMAEAQKGLSDGLRISVVDNRIHAVGPFSTKAKLKKVSGARWSGTVKAWTYPASVTCARNLYQVFGDEARYDDTFRSLLAQGEAADTARAAKTADDLPDIPNLKTSAWRHQRQAFHFAKEQPGSYLAMEMGTGKSLVTVGLLSNSDVKLALILCPVSVMRVWPREFRTHAAKDWNVVVLDKKVGTVKKRIAHAEAEIAKSLIPGQPVAIVINYEAAGTNDFADWVMSRTWDYLVLDESHRAKAPNGQRAKAFAKFATKAKRKVCLSGTPMPQTPLDIWAQFRILDPHIYGSSFHRFKNTYALWGGYQDREFQGMNPLTIQDFEDRMAAVTYRATADILDLPEDRDAERICTLSAKAQKIYDGVAKELYAEVEDARGRSKSVSMENVLTKLLRLQQITGGAVNHDGGETVEVDTSKSDLLQDILEDIDKPVVVFAKFVHDLDKIKEVATKLGRNYGELSGRQNDLNDDAKMPEWADVFAVQIQAGGVGIDLTRADVGVYYSVGYSLGDYLQSRARLVRPGQESEVMFYHLVAAGTIDEQVYKALTAKQKIVDHILDVL